MDANDHVIRLLDCGENQMEKGEIDEAILTYKVANLLLKHLENLTETALLIKCLKCLSDAYQAMGNEQEAKRFRRAVDKVKKKLKSKKLPVNDGVSVAESVVVLQPQDSAF